MRCQFLTRSSRHNGASLLLVKPFFHLRNNFGEHSLAKSGPRPWTEFQGAK